MMALLFPEKVLLETVTGSSVVEIRKPPWLLVSVLPLTVNDTTSPDT